MYIGGSIFLIAVGAILRYATNFDVSGVDIDTVGLILMIAGAALLVISFAVMIFNSEERRRRGAPPPPPQDPGAPRY